MHRHFCTPPRLPSEDEDENSEKNSRSSNDEDEDEEEDDNPEVNNFPKKQIVKKEEKNETKCSHLSWQRATTRAVLMYAALIIVHHAGANLYSRICTSQTIHGLFMSPFLVPAPHCEGLRWIVYHGAARINGMWILIGSQVVEFVARMFITKKM